MRIPPPALAGTGRILQARDSTALPRTFVDSLSTGYALAVGAYDRPSLSLGP